MKDNYLYMNSEETRSLGSISYSYGYQEIYENYLSQFKNKKVKNLLKKNYEELVNGYFLKR